MDFHFRKYRPDWGRFTQPDTLIQDVYNPQMLNRYSFEVNNPVKHTDPTGHVLPLAAIAVARGVITLINLLPTINAFAEGELTVGEALIAASDIIITTNTDIFGLALSTANVILFFQDREKYIREGGFSLTKDIIEKNRPKTEKVVTEADPKCGTVKCPEERQPETQGQQNIGGQIPSNVGNQANTAKTVTPPTSSGSVVSGSGSGGITEVSSGGRKIGVSGGRVRYNIPSSATYSSGFSSQLGSGKMKSRRR